MVQVVAVSGCALRQGTAAGRLQGRRWAAAASAACTYCRAPPRPPVRVPQPAAPGVFLGWAGARDRAAARGAAECGDRGGRESAVALLGRGARPARGGGGQRGRGEVV